MNHALTVVRAFPGVVVQAFVWILSINEVVDVFVFSSYWVVRKATFDNNVG